MSAMAREETVLVEVPASVHTSIRACIAERDAGMAIAQDGDITGWNKNLIDQAIDVLAATGRPFSANDLRVLLTDVDLPGPLFGSRFHHAANNRKVIRYVGQTRSTKRNTHGKPVALWVGIPSALT